ncbi:MAG: heavy metal translocating P-type ATPase [Clostridia bacterium]|nr:heavy metal translocating P-type ATPase [Clostridia bacterium]
MKKIKFDIQGMTCSSCSSHIEKAVNKLSGIQNANVNLLSNNMIVEYDENILDDTKIIQAVENAGYRANIAEKRKKYDKPEKTKNSNNEDIKSMKKRLIISICLLVPLMYIAMHHMLYEWFGLPVPQIVKDLFHGQENSISFGFTQFLLLLPIIYVNRNYFIVGFKRLFKGAPNMDSLIAIGSLAATVYGIFAIYMIGYGLGHNKIEIVERYSMDIYFESAGTILTLITVGKYLETKSKGKTSEAISKLINLAPKTAIVLREEKEIELDLEKIVIGDIIVIRPGGSIPVDGIIIEGSTSVDQSSITGESIPVEKTIGDNVISGTINKNGYIKMKATKVGDNTTLSQIIKLVEEASNSKAQISKIADKVSGIFVPAVITIAILTVIIWLMTGKSFEFAWTMGIAVLVISCPCALGLATPVAIMVGTGKGAENGILIKSAESLELLHLVDTVVLDKTGTITEGKPKVTDIISNIEEKELLKIAGSLEKNSEHPLAEAIIEKTKDKKIELIECKEFTAVSGRGIKGKIDGKNYFGGNISFMKENDIDISQVAKKSDELLNMGKTVLYFANESVIIGIIAVADTIKDTSYQAIQELKEKNIKVAMITGDNKVVAETIGRQLGINQVISEVLPQDKEKEVAKLQKNDKKVAFVGDGINDSPALVKSDVGIAIGSGTDIAIESADIVLMKNSLLDVVTAISLSKAVIKNIKMNLFWAFFYNAIGIPVACGIFYPSFGLKLNPMIGAAAMSLSSVCVVTNALRLRKFKSKFKEEKHKVNEFVKTINIEGMQCNHCKMSVEKALNEINGITKVEVNLEKKTAIIKSSIEISNEEIKSKVSDAGFEIISIK